jgi:hypothetical protein
MAVLIDLHCVKGTSAVADNQIKDRSSTFFGASFMPLIRHDQMQGAPERQAYAGEYAAYQPGEINGKPGRLMDLLEIPISNGAAK